MQLSIKRYLICASLSQAVKCCQIKFSVSRDTKQHAELRCDARYLIVFSIQSVQLVFSYTPIFKKFNSVYPIHQLLYHGRSSLIRRFIYGRWMVCNFLHYSQRAHYYTRQKFFPSNNLFIANELNSFTSILYYILKSKLKKKKERDLEEG